MLWLLGVIAAAVVLHTLGQRRNTTDAFGRSEDDIRYPWERPLLRCPRLLITYVDFEGNATEREITPKLPAQPRTNQTVYWLTATTEKRRGRSFWRASRPLLSLELARLSQTSNGSLNCMRAPNNRLMQNCRR